MSITIAIDRDGTINDDSNSYVKNSYQFKPILGSLEAITLLRNKGYNVVIFSNQCGILKGELTIDDVDSVHQHLLDLLGSVGCRSIDGIYYSTSNLKTDMFAIPNTGMFKKAETEQKLKFKGGAFVSSNVNHLKVSKKIGALPILVKTGSDLDNLKKLNTFANKELKSKTQIFENLWEFATSLPDISNDSI